MEHVPAVRAIIVELQKISPQQAHEPEIGLNSGARDALDLLGWVGGAQAVDELRRWMHSDAAPDIRAVAPAALATPEAWTIVGNLRTRDNGAWQQRVDETLRSPQQTTTPTASRLNGRLGFTRCCPCGSVSARVRP